MFKIPIIVIVNFLIQIISIHFIKNPNPFIEVFHWIILLTNFNFNLDNSLCFVIDFPIFSPHYC